MSPQMEEMLVNDVVPRLRAAARSIQKVGHEDDEEIVQDCTLMAARTMDSAEKAGQKFGGGNIAYYVTRAARREVVPKNGASVLAMEPEGFGGYSHPETNETKEKNTQCRVQGENRLGSPQGRQDHQSDRPG